MTGQAIPEPVQAALETVLMWMSENGYGAAVVEPQGDFAFKTRQELAVAQSWAEARRNTWDVPDRCYPGC